MEVALKILGLVLLYWFSGRIIRRWVPWVRRKIVAYMIESGFQDSSLEDRAETLGLAFRKALLVLVRIVIVVAILHHLGLNISPLLTGMGIMGVALGFGARAVIQDMLAGFFLLLENRMRVGDTVRINGVDGILKAIRFRTTILIDESGNLHVFQNGSISSLVNLKGD